jgi:hypothetical protein
MVGAEGGPDILGIRFIGLGREPDQVAEQHGDELPLFSATALLGRQRGAAGQTESGPGRILFSADGANDHARSLEGRLSGGRSFVTPGNLMAPTGEAHVHHTTSMDLPGVAVRNCR